LREDQYEPRDVVLFCATEISNLRNREIEEATTTLLRRAGKYWNICAASVFWSFLAEYTRTQQFERENEDMEGFYALMTWRRQKKILSDPVLMSALDFFQKRTKEGPLGRRRLIEELKVSERESLRTTEYDIRYRYTTSTRMWELRTDYETTEWCSTCTP
jgi:hypothetical protein